MSSHALTYGAAPRLAPVARPRSLWLWLFNFIVRRQLGKPMTPAQVLYARMPKLLVPQASMLLLLQHGLSLPALLVHVLQARVSMHNGCTFCMDLHQAMALREGHGRDKLIAAVDPSHPAEWTEQERAALAFADESTQHGHVSDVTFAALRAVYSEKQIVELTWLCAFTTYLNRLATPLDIGSDGFCAIAEARAEH
ncbi:MAG TPA: carboxymuconolactone decarboxylase family protein [Polyangiales bacterium]|jgi:AhpD family alkylhydroperoxidase|nr:carboxymuconolactone decarboxylase family protein [Polyangiales bacterium]